MADSKAAKMALALKYYIEGGGKDLKNAMMQAGYKKGYSKDSTSLAMTRTWQSMLEEFFPDDYLAVIHQSLFFTRKGRYNRDGERVSEEDDIDTRIKALDMAYKIRNKYVTEIRFRDPFENLTVEEIEEETNKAKSKVQRYNESLLNSELDPELGIVGEQRI